MVFVHRNEDCFFVICPFTLFEFRIQMVNKSLPTLLPLAPWQVRCNLCPFSSILTPFFSQYRVFLGCPGSLSFNDRWIRNGLPFCQAIDCSISIRKIRGYLVPTRRSYKNEIDSNQNQEKYTKNEGIGNLKKQRIVFLQIASKPNSNHAIHQLTIFVVLYKFFQ